MDTDTQTHDMHTENVQKYTQTHKGAQTFTDTHAQKYTDAMT